MQRKNKKEVPVVTRFTTFFDFALVDSTNPSNSSPICRLEFDIVSGEKCPKATENFRQLAAGIVTVGEKRNARQAAYKGSRLLRVTPEMIQLGDTTGNVASSDGKCQDTIFGTLIEDEAFGVVPHNFGVLSLCNSGPNTNGSQFSIIVGGGGKANSENDDGEEQNTTATTNFSFLDSRHVSLGYLRDPQVPIVPISTNNANAAMMMSSVISSGNGASAAPPSSGRGGNSKESQQQQQQAAAALLAAAAQQNNNNSFSIDDQRDALRKLHKVASSLTIDKSGKLPNSGVYIIVADCGVY